MRNKFTWFGKQIIKRRKNEPLIMEALSAERKTYHIDEILKSSTSKEIKLKKHKEELEKRVSKNNEHLTGIDSWGKERRYEAPIMKPNEVATAKRNKSSWWVVTAILLIFDSFFASLIVPFILPSNVNVWVQLLVGTSIAVLIILCCEAGFKNLSKYFEGRLLLRKGELSDEDKSTVNNKLPVAVIYIVAGITATLFVAMVRYIFLENVSIPANGANDVLSQLNNKLASGSKYASAATFVLAFIVIFLFGWYSLQKNKYSIRYSLYRKYEKNGRRINWLVNKINKLDNLFWHRLKDNLESAWSLMLHIRKILKRTVDEDNKSKEAEFLTLSERENFVIDDNTYRKYQKVASCNRELFIYGIEESKEVRVITLSWRKLMAEINSLVDNYKDVHHTKTRLVAPKKIALIPQSVNMIFLIVGLFLFASCNKNKNLNVVGFVDLSNSANAEAKQLYLKTVRQLLNELPCGSSLTVLPIDGSTEKGSTEFITVKIPESSFFQSNLDPPNQKLALEKYRFDVFKDSIVRVVGEGLNKISPVYRTKKDNQETDVLGAFRLLGKYEDTLSKSTVNIALILSDMLNCNHELNIENKIYDSTAQQKLIASLRKVDLSRWHILILTGQAQISSEKYLSVKDFWGRYLTECKNTDYTYVSGAESLLFKRLNDLAATNEKGLFASN